MSRVLVFLALCLFGMVQSNQNRNQLSSSEIQRIFHRKADEVPDYKFVKVNEPKVRRTRKDVRLVEFEVDDGKVQLQLTPFETHALSRYIPVWTVETDRQNPSGHSYHRVEEEKVNVDGSFYKDVDEMAMLLAYYKNNNIYYDGVFGESTKTKVIRSVPEKWWVTPEQYRNHVVFDVKQEKAQTLLVNEGADQLVTRKLDTPLDIMYPKLLVIIENELFKALNEDISETIKYVSTFWNAVNLKYSKLTQPQVKVVVSGLIIAKDETAFRYIYDSRNETDMNQFNHVKLLQSQSTYFATDSQVDFKDYDSTMTMLKLSAGGVAGSAYRGRICAENLNVGFVRDDASFSGLLAATHELGHLLNLPHDETGAAKDCKGYPEDGISTVMAAFEISVNKHVWSECSKRILQEFASFDVAECLKYPSKA